MIGIHEVRARASAALAPAGDGDPQVIGLTDAVVAPCLQVAWSQPWLVANPALQHPVAFFARLSVLAIGGRVEASAALDELEDLATYTISRLALDPLPWAPLEITAPRGMQIGGVDYLIARFTYQVPVDGSATRVPPARAVA